MMMMLMKLVGMKEANDIILVVMSNQSQQGDGNEEVDEVDELGNVDEVDEIGRIKYPPDRGLFARACTGCLGRLFRGG